MKYIFNLICILGSFAAFGQKATNIDSLSEEPVYNYSIVHEVPLIEGCEVYEGDDTKYARQCFQNELLKQVAKNFRGSTRANRKKISAKIYVGFVIEKDASISNIQVIRGLSQQYEDASEEEWSAAVELDVEAVRVVQQFKLLAPAKLNNEPVRIAFTLPIALTYL